ncbi:MAG TPA: hypothetical protein VFK09_06225 [Gemmatimonadales bacterium]|jgi:hypothetical protein|nr:hypothetical protein [Gemmatimonadales bacterium]
MLRKAFAVSCIAVVLGAQAWTIVPPGGRQRVRHWPFLDYPMYSAAHHAGDSIQLQELRAVACDRSDTIAVPASALRIELGRYWKLLYDLSRSAKPDALVDTLGRLTRAGTRADVCALQVWRKVLRVEPAGVRVEERPWVESGEWPLQPDTARRAAARRP